jgi:topoisomerase-4 subunit A
MINHYETVLADESLIDKEIIDNLKAVRKEFDSPRRSDLVAEIEEIKIDKEDLIKEEDVYISVSKDGYVKRSSNRSYQAASQSVPTTKDEDYIVSIMEANTLDKLVIITSKGNYAYIPVYTILEKP